MSLNALCNLKDYMKASRNTPRGLQSLGGKPSDAQATNFNTMSKHKTSKLSDHDVIAMLKRYNCPVPFHTVRTLFLGSIASPSFNISPIQVVQSLWGGEFPVFETPDEVNVLFDVLLSGLWNRLTGHQKSRDPFRLVRFNTEPTRESVAHLAQVRRQELGGFLDGLFGGNESIDLPEKAHQSVDVLFDLSDMFGGAANLLDDPSKPAAVDDLKGLLRNFQQMSIIVETEINRVVLDCERARKRPSNFAAADNRTLH